MKAASLAWRSQHQRRELVTKISTILLQRHNWALHLSTFNLSPTLTPSFFLQILNKIQSNPQVSLNFFNWAKTQLGFQPDLKAHCKIIRILIQSGDTRPVKPIWDSLVQLYPPTHIVDSMVQACNGTESLPLAFSSLIGRYAQKGLHFDCLKVFRNVVQLGFVPKVDCCNAVLDVLEHKNELRLALCLYGWMTRNGVLMDSNTWPVVARILCRNGKIERAVRLLDSGIYNSTIFNLAIDSFSKCGNFEAAFDRLKEMYDLKIEPGFNTYSSVLDGACEFGNSEVIEMVMHIMMKKKLMPVPLSSEYDDVIKKFSDAGKTYAAGMLFRRAKDEGVTLKSTTLGCMLRAFSKGGRVKEAMNLYNVILQKGVVFGNSYYQAFADILCRENPSEEVNTILIDLIRKGVSPRASEISKFMTLHCRNGRWQEAEDLLNVILEQGFLPDSSCCNSLVKHYCCCGQIESAISVHHKLEKLGAVLDVTAYNQLLRGLFADKRVEEAVKMFDYMRTKNVVSSATFLVMISGLYNEKEMRRAMQVHDEMLKMGLKPSRKTYNSLITVFR